MFEGIAAAHVVFADFCGDFGGLVFEERVEVRYLVIDIHAGTDAFNSCCVHFVVEGLLGQMIVLAGLVHGEVVLFYVAAEEAAAVPLLFVNEHRPSDSLAVYLLLTHV